MRFSILLALILSLPVFASPTYVIFDLGGVLIQTKGSAAACQLGYKNLAHFALTHVSKILVMQRYAQERLFNYLDTLEGHAAPTEARSPSGQVIPSLMCRYFKGAPSIALKSQIFEDFDRSAFFYNNAEKNLLRAMISMIFTPEKFITTQILDPLGEQCVYRCIAQGLIPCIHSTWDKESFGLLQTKYPEFFAVFGDRIFISGATGFMKPEINSFTNILSTLHAQPNECIFIDDRIENIQAAQQCGMYGIICPSQRAWYAPWKMETDFAYVNTIIDAHLKQYSQLRATA